MLADFKPVYQFQNRQKMIDNRCRVYRSFVLRSKNNWWRFNLRKKKSLSEFQHRSCQCFACQRFVPCTWYQRDIQWSLRCKTAPSAGLKQFLVGVRSHVRVHFVLEILLGAEGGRSHKTSRSYNRGSYNAGTTVDFTAWFPLRLKIHLNSYKPNCKDHMKALSTNVNKLRLSFIFQT